MIIVSQDKEMIVNFDNLTHIEILLSSDTKVFKVVINYNNDYKVLGFYETEERAKEVLQEIANTYTKIGIEFETFNGGKQQLLPIYEMPGE